LCKSITGSGSSSSITGSQLLNILRQAATSTLRGVKGAAEAAATAAAAAATTTTGEMLQDSTAKDAASKLQQQQQQHQQQMSSATSAPVSAAAAAAAGKDQGVSQLDGRHLLRLACPQLMVGYQVGYDM
jgi:hypothetical protein